jgi:hypothetical protein
MNCEEGLKDGVRVRVRYIFQISPRKRYGLRNYEVKKIREQL